MRNLLNESVSAKPVHLICRQIKYLINLWATVECLALDIMGNRYKILQFRQTIGIF